MLRIQVHIEKLVLHGFPAGDRHKIAAAVEYELAQLLNAGSVPRLRQNPPAVDRINAGEFKLKAGVNLREVGAQIARSVFQSFRLYARAHSRNVGFQPAPQPGGVVTAAQAGQAGPAPPRRLRRHPSP